MDLNRQAENIVNSMDIKQALEDLRGYYLEDVSITAKAIMEEHIKAGFTEEQAFDIAKSYTLEFCSLEWVEGD